MTGWLLDTNVLSMFAPGKPAIAPKLVTWFEDRIDALYLSSITAAEIEAGISKAHRTGPPRRADELRAWFERMLSFYADRVLPFDLTVARIAGALSDAASASLRKSAYDAPPCSSFPRKRLSGNPAERHSSSPRKRGPRGKHLKSLGSRFRGDYERSVQVADTRNWITASLRGDDKNLSSLPSEDTEAGWVRHIRQFTQPGTSQRS